ncbi:MAG TPA: flagellar motor switch protein FliG [Vicinamibacterales bacterium]|jgi:flagellar motor switch protein FliG|nr:flagellar motor switch protein FliG [Vicinamibacterales bacterium]
MAVSTSSTTTVSGAKKAAIAVMALGEDGALPIFKYLGEDEIERIALEIAAMGSVPPELGEQVLTELSASANAPRAGLGGVEQARRILTKSLGAEQSRRIVDRVVKSMNTSAGFASLERANPEQLSKFFLGEHPQTTALILAHLPTGVAAQLLEQLPDEMRADVLLRIASLGEIPPDVIARISSVIEQRLRGLGGQSREQRGGVRAVAELFNCLDRGVRSPALERLETLAPETATAIRNLMFVFEDLVNVEESGIREIVNRADKKTLTMALKGASDAIRDRFFANMSKRAVDLMKEEMEMLGAVRLREVEKAHQEIVSIARKLEEEGLITTGAGAGEPYVT